MLIVNILMVLLTDRLGVFFVTNDINMIRIIFYILTGKFPNVISPTFKTASQQLTFSDILE